MMTRSQKISALGGLIVGAASTLLLQSFIRDAARGLGRQNGKGAE